MKFVLILRQSRNIHIFNIIGFLYLSIFKGIIFVIFIINQSSQLMIHTSINILQTYLYLKARTYIMEVILYVVNPLLGQRQLTAQSPNIQICGGSFILYYICHTFHFVQLQFFSLMNLLVFVEIQQQGSCKYLHIWQILKYFTRPFDQAQKYSFLEE